MPPRLRQASASRFVIGLAGLISAIPGTFSAAANPRAVAPGEACRVPSLDDQSPEVDWTAAESACDQMLQKNPLNPEAHAIKQKIRRERQMSEHFHQGKILLESSGEAQALDQFVQIPPSSAYFARAKALAGAIAEKVKMKAASDCRRFLTTQHWTRARIDCERYSQLACQTGSALDTKLGMDPVHRRFVKTRKQLEPDASPWSCVRLELFSADVDLGAQPRREIVDALGARYRHPEIAAAVALYWENRMVEAKVQLQKLLAGPAEAHVRALAKEALANIDRATAMSTEGEIALRKDDLRGADRSFQDALRADAGLIRGIPKAYPSELHKRVGRLFAQKALELGKRSVEQGNVRQACAHWRRGYQYFAGNPDLPRARKLCSRLALENLHRAPTCQELVRVLDYAMDGDGIKEAVSAKKVEMKCP